MSAKKNYTPIPFETALQTCSKGSQQKVIWQCPRCKVEGIRIFKSAIKIKLCGVCQGQDQVKTFDNRGENNPWFGKVPTCVKYGSDHPNWKGGKPVCSDCATPLSERGVKFCKKCFQKGPRNHAFKPELTVEHRSNRREFDPENNWWKQEVKRRDGFICQLCLVKGGVLHAHHLNSWKKFPEQRYDLNNGVTLCKTCHQGFHSSCGVMTTLEQFIEYSNPEMRKEA